MRPLLLLAGLLAVGSGSTGRTVAYRWRLVRTPDRTAPADLRFAQAGSDPRGTVGVGAFAPETVVRSVRSEKAGKSAGIEFSLDGGAHWRPSPSPPPDGGGGGIAVSADGRVWVCGNDRTEDYGFVWTPCEDLPVGVRVVADRTSPGRFYAVGSGDGMLYTSIDGAKTFRARPLSFSMSGECSLYASPRRSGDLWLAGGTTDLYHSPPARPFSKVPRVIEIEALGFGPGVSETGGTTLLLAGAIDLERGIFRSEDSAQTWVRLEGPAFLGRVFAIEADPKKIGRLYVSCEAGLYCGDPR